MNVTRLFRLRPKRVGISTHAKWRVDQELLNRQIEKRAELLEKGANVDKPQKRIDYDAMPIG